jgi:peptidyl-prolyl cis-trans isomerase C
MKSLLFVTPLACLLAQTPPAPAPAAPAAPAGQPAAKAPTVTLQPALPPVPAAVPPDKVVLTIGDEKVTAGEIDHLINMIPEQYRNQARTARRQFAENVIRLKVMAQEARRRKLDQTPAYKDQLAFQSEQLLAQTLYQNMLTTAKVDDATAQSYYDQHKSEYEQVKARHILIRFKGSPVPLRAGQKELTEEEALAKAQEIRKKLVDGADFAALAKSESDDVGSAANGGDLGTFSHGRMVPAFEQVAFTLPVGQISEPVKSQFGYHIIKVESRQDKSFADARPELEKKLPAEMVQKEMEQLKNSTAVVMDPEYFGPAPAAIRPPSLAPQAKPPAAPQVK